MLESDIDLSIVDESTMIISYFFYNKLSTLNKLLYNNSKYLYFWKLFCKLGYDINRYLYDNEQ